MDTFPPLTAPPSKSTIVKRLWFVRHGETPQNALHVLQGGGIDPELSDKGVQQANRLANRLSKASFDLLVSSDMKVHYAI